MRLLDYAMPEGCAQPAADLVFECHGSLWLVRPQSEVGSDWLAKTAPDDAMFFSEAMAVESRYVDDVFIAAREAGLEVM